MLKGQLIDIQHIRVQCSKQSDRVVQTRISSKSTAARCRSQGKIRRKPNGLRVRSAYSENLLQSALTNDNYAAKLNIRIAGFFHMTQLAIAEMQKQGSGHVMQITTSVVDDENSAALPLPSLTKGGLSAATKRLAIECARRGIQVNTVAPAVIKSPMHPVETTVPPEAAAIYPLRIAVPEADLAYLRQRLTTTRWSDREAFEDRRPGAKAAEILVNRATRTHPSPSGRMAPTWSRTSRQLSLLAAATMLCASGAFAQTASEVLGPAAVVPLAVEQPPARVVVDPPLAEPLAQGLVVLQYRTENLRIVPVFGPPALAVSPRIGHLHVTVDDLPWDWAAVSGDPLIIQHLPPGPHRVRVELNNANHHALNQRVVEFVIPDIGQRQRSMTQVDTATRAGTAAAEQPPARIVVDPPLAEPLARGVPFLQVPAREPADRVRVRPGGARGFAAHRTRPRHRRRSALALGGRERRSHHHPEPASRSAPGPGRARRRQPPSP